MKPITSLAGVARSRAALAVVVALLVGATTACSDLALKSRLAHARRSPEALAEAALRAIEAQDAEALDALRVTREEYRELLWPALPDRNQMPFDFAWSITHPRSRKARRDVLLDFEGVPLELVRVEPGDDVEVYDSFVLHRDARMIVRRTDTGDEGVLPLMDTLVEMGRGWKFMNFRDRP